MLPKHLLIWSPKPGLRVTALVACAVLGSCQPAPGTSTRPVTVRDSAGVTIVANTIGSSEARCLLDSVPSVSIGVVDGSSVEQLFRVSGAAKLADGKIVIANAGTTEIRLFDPQGRFLSAVGSQGEGPGEFRAMFQMYLGTGDTLWIRDQHPSKYQIYTSRGEWSHTVHLDAGNLDENLRLRQVVPLADGRVAAMVPPQVTFDERFEPKEARVLLLHLGGAPPVDYGSYNWGSWGIFKPRRQRAPADLVAVPRLLEARVWLSGAGREFIVADGAVPEVVVYGFATRNPTRIIRFTVPDQTVTERDLDLARRRFRDRMRELPRGVAETVPVANQVPALSGLRMGVDGRIWVKEFPRSDEGTEGWLVFGNGGRFECRANLTTFSNLYQLGADYVLGGERDELGVERVRSYALSGPAMP